MGQAHFLNEARGSELRGVTLRCHASAEETPISYIRVEWVYEKTPMKSRVRAPINWRLFDCYIARRSLEQTTANQERELRQVAGRMGCEIVKVYKDYGISGAKGRDKRPASMRSAETQQSANSIW